MTFILTAIVCLPLAMLALSIGLSGFPLFLVMFVAGFTFSALITLLMDE